MQVLASLPSPRKPGKTIAFVEEWDFGGTCPNRGCTPKKVLMAAAHALHEIELASVHGIDVGKPKLDWGKLIDREKDMIGFIPDAMAGGRGKARHRIPWACRNYCRAWIPMRWLQFRRNPNASRSRSKPV